MTTHSPNTAQSLKSSINSLSCLVSSTHRPAVSSLRSSLQTTASSHRQHCEISLKPCKHLLATTLASPSHAELLTNLASLFTSLVHAEVAISLSPPVDPSAIPDLNSLGQRERSSLISSLESAKSGVEEAKERRDSACDELGEMETRISLCELRLRDATASQKDSTYRLSNFEAERAILLRKREQPIPKRTGSGFLSIFAPFALSNGAMLGQQIEEAEAAIEALRFRKEGEEKELASVQEELKELTEERDGIEMKRREAEEVVWELETEEILLETISGGLGTIEQEVEELRREVEELRSGVARVMEEVERENEKVRRGKGEVAQVIATACRMGWPEASVWSGEALKVLGRVLETDAEEEEGGVVLRRDAEGQDGEKVRGDEGSDSGVEMEVSASGSCSEGEGEHEE